MQAGAESGEADCAGNQAEDAEAGQGDEGKGVAAHGGIVNQREPLADSAL